MMKGSFQMMDQSPGDEIVKYGPPSVYVRHPSGIDTDAPEPSSLLHPTTDMAITSTTDANTLGRFNSVLMRTNLSTPRYEHHQGSPLPRKPYIMPDMGGVDRAADP
jgi:hypothetical protein